MKGLEDNLFHIKPSGSCRLSCTPYNEEGKVRTSGQAGEKGYVRLFSPTTSTSDHFDCSRATTL